MKEYESIVSEAQATDHLMGILVTSTLIAISQEMNDLMGLLKSTDKTAEECLTLVSDTLSPEDYPVFKEIMKIQGKNMMGMGTDVKRLKGNTKATTINLKDNPKNAMVYGSPIILEIVMDIISQYMLKGGTH